MLIAKAAEDTRKERAAAGIPTYPCRQLHVSEAQSLNPTYATVVIFQNTVSPLQCICYLLGVCTTFGRTGPL